MSAPPFRAQFRLFHGFVVEQRLGVYQSQRQTMEHVGNPVSNAQARGILDVPWLASEGGFGS